MKWCRSIITGTWLRYVRVFPIANPSVVCNVRAPYSGGWNFRQYSFAISYLSHPLTCVQNFTEIVPGESLRRVAKYTFGYLISWWVSCWHIQLIIFRASAQLRRNPPRTPLHYLLLASGTGETLHLPCTVCLSACCHCCCVRCAAFRRHFACYRASTPTGWPKKLAQFFCTP